jgi:hypothetical protein
MWLESLKEFFDTVIFSSHRHGAITGGFITFIVSVMFVQFLYKSETSRETKVREIATNENVLSAEKLEASCSYATTAGEAVTERVQLDVVAHNRYSLKISKDINGKVTAIKSSHNSLDSVTHQLEQKSILRMGDLRKIS